ncbi:hypothetical protein PGT21_026479 [Puccinia graminis f. sp. tritici]|uniref:Uncharacterized protein n=1 Tax=Puccinia graminis f. sp. tritici TaxID=56615 RepID=A0A5B0LPF0_PUCGR|nr:hypothetical protein PGT21_026479 [Puccinia graminis f. sp. tritici]
MHFLGALTSITLMVSLPFTILSNDFPNNYIMKNMQDTAKGYMEIFTADGKLAYCFTKKPNGSSQDKMTTILETGSLQKIFALSSVSRVTTQTMNDSRWSQWF